MWIRVLYNAKIDRKDITLYFLDKDKKHAFMVVNEYSTVAVFEPSKVGKYTYLQNVNGKSHYFFTITVNILLQMSETLKEH